MILILEHFPVLQILPLFLGGLCCVFTSYNIKITKILVFFSVLSSIFFSIYGIVFASFPYKYSFGNWESFIGIEYKIDFIKQLIIVYLNLTFLFFLSLGNELLEISVLLYLQKRRQSLFYTVIMFLHASNIAIISTNDIFNLYIFIEIASLTTCVLIAQGKNIKSLVGAFDYLIFSTLSGAFLLIGIAFILVYSGNLNMDFIQNVVNQNNNKDILFLGISFFLFGILLKSSFFPLHFWILKSYTFMPTIILVYILGTSNIVNFYLILYFIKNIINYNLVERILIYIIKPLSLFSIIIFSFYSLKERSVKRIFIFSSFVQLGWSMLLVTSKEYLNYVFPFLFSDSLNKIAISILLANREVEQNNFQEHNKLFMFLVSIILIFNAGLPISNMFFLKIKIFEIYISSCQWVGFLVLLVSSIIGIIYNINFFKFFFFNSNRYYYISNNKNFFYLKYFSISILIMLQFLMMGYLQSRKIFY